MDFFHRILKLYCAASTVTSQSDTDKTVFIFMKMYTEVYSFLVSLYIRYNPEFQKSYATVGQLALVLLFWIASLILQNTYWNNANSRKCYFSLDVYRILNDRKMSYSSGLCCLCRTILYNTWHNIRVMYPQMLNITGQKDD